MSVRKNVGRITAYAAAVEGGYEGTYEQFCRDQANFAKDAAELAENAVQVAANLEESKQVLADVKHEIETGGVKQLEVKVNDNTARITALEQKKVTAPYYVDDSVAYTKDVPEDALPSAEINKVGGMTRKCTNLYSGGDLTFTKSTIVPLSVPLKAGTYSMRALITSSDTDAASTNADFLDADKKFISDVRFSRGVYSSATGTIDRECHYIQFKAATTLSNSDGDTATWTDIMLNEGESVLPFETGFDGLRSAPVTEIVSEGVNLFNANSFAGTNISIVENPDRTYTITNISAYAKTIFVSLKGTLSSGTYTIKNNSTKQLFVMLKSGDHSNIVYGDRVKTFEYDGVSYLTLKFADFASGESVTTGIMLNKGSTALPYEPYRSDTLPIPAAIQALDGYGWGLDEKCYNYVDLEKKQFVKRVNRADMGTLEWKINSSSNPYVYYVRIPDIKPAENNEETHKGLLCAKYKISETTTIETIQDKSIYRNRATSSAPNAVLLKDSDFSDNGSLLIESLQGEMLYYELAEPVITDISAMLTEDNYIPVEAGGTLTMANEYGYDVPSEVTFARLTWQ